MYLPIPCSALRIRYAGGSQDVEWSPFRWTSTTKRSRHELMGGGGNDSDFSSNSARSLRVQVLFFLTALLRVYFYRGSPWALAPRTKGYALVSAAMAHPLVVATSFTTSPPDAHWMELHLLAWYDPASSGSDPSPSKGPSPIKPGAHLQPIARVKITVLDP